MRGQTLSSFIEYPYAVAVFERESKKLVAWDAVIFEDCAEKLIEMYKKKYSEDKYIVLFVSAKEV